MKLSSKIGSALLAVAFAASANAALITGVVSFDGTAVLNTNNLLLATSVASWADTQVGTLHTGSFSGLATNQVASFPNSWTFGSGVSPLWTVGGFTFDLTSSAIESQTASALVVAGTGLVSGNGFMPTVGTFRFTTQTPSDGVNFSFSSSARAVPDGGATVALLGLSFLGLGGVSRFIRRK